MVHHGVWDYDNPTGPNLLDITVDGRRVKALAQVTKQGFVYVFDRVTGEPIWPIEERRVATDTDLDGEILSPTQPFPTKPPPFEYQGATIDDLIDFTPEVRRMAEEAVEGFRLGPLYTPLSLRGTIFRPSAGGGASWSGASVDPETGVLYVPSRNTESVMRFREPAPGEASTLRYILSRGNAAFIEAGNPDRRPVMPQGLPLWKPPYSRMTAIDMNAGEHLWMAPLGNGDRIRNHPLLRHLDLPPVGGDSSRSGAAPYEDAARARADGRGDRRRPAARRLRQGVGGGPGGHRPARRRHRHADDVQAGRPAVHRAYRRRRGALAGRIQAAVVIHAARIIPPDGRPPLAASHLQASLVGQPRLA